MRRASNNLLAGLECRTAWSEVSGVCGTLRFNQCQYLGAPAHRSRAYFRATKRRAAVSEQTATRKIPALQHSEGQAAHKSVAGAGGIDDADIESGHAVHRIGAGHQATIRAHRHRHDFRTHAQKRSEEHTSEL